MNLNKFALTLTAAALLPTFAFAGTDEVAASFERDLHRTPATSQTVLVARAADPLVDAINIALYRTTDQVLASFERDLNREPVVNATEINEESDPLVKAITVALRNDAAKPAVHAVVTSNQRRGS